jgi:hypothetical protein
MIKRALSEQPAANHCAELLLENNSGARGSPAASDRP